MEVIFMLIGFSLVVALIFLGLFFWAVKSGQYDDSYTPSVRVLFGNEHHSKEKETETNNRDN